MRVAYDAIAELYDEPLRVELDRQSTMQIGDCRLQIDLAQGQVSTAEYRRLARTSVNRR
jgi:hypothetical protein